jgi:hypothetical protein
VPQRSGAQRGHSNSAGLLKVALGHSAPSTARAAIRDMQDIGGCGDASRALLFFRRKLTVFVHPPHHRPHLCYPQKGSATRPRVATVAGTAAAIIFVVVVVTFHVLPAAVRPTIKYDPSEPLKERRPSTLADACALDDRRAARRPAACQIAPADRPVQAPTKLDWSSTSRPQRRWASKCRPTLLTRADEVIE